MKSRKVKQKVKPDYCRGPHRGPWTHVQTDKGLKHTCSCGYHYTEAKKEVTLTTYRKGKEVNGKGLANLNV